VRRRRYVLKRERKFEDCLPSDGQAIYIRISGHKTYIRAWWDADTQCAIVGKDDDPSYLRKTYLMGWLPVPIPWGTLK